MNNKDYLLLFRHLENNFIFWSTEMNDYKIICVYLQRQF